MVESIESGLESFKSNHPDYYWQLVSSAILTGVDKAELIFVVPYLSELKDIKEFVGLLKEEDLPKDLNLFQIEWISLEITSYLEFDVKPLQIPYLPNDSEYKDFNNFIFDVPSEDKEFLTERVKMAIDKKNEI